MKPEELLARAEKLLADRDLIAARTGFMEACAAGANVERCHGALWLTHMLLGDFEAAWQQSDALRLHNAPDPHRFWNGEDLRGKRVIVRCLHGFGDAVQMLRYAPGLNAMADHVTWEVPPRFVALAGFFEGVENIMTWGDAAPATAPAWEVQVEVMELPYLFRTQLGDLPVATRYLSLPKDKIQKAGYRMGSWNRLRVGVAWCTGDWNPSRDIPFACIQGLIQDDACEFWSLQTQPPGNGELRHQVAVTGEGLAEMAAAIANLDLVITVDTLAAHLAGALGKRCWLMLQYAADWRWMHGRSDSPWYASVEVFRQPSPGDWPAVIGKVQQRLASLT